MVKYLLQSTGRTRMNLADELPAIASVYNTQKHSSLGYAPATVFFGGVINQPSEMVVEEEVSDAHFKRKTANHNYIVLSDC